MSEPTWARGISDVQLRHACRVQNIRTMGDESRSQLVALCDPAAVLRGRLGDVYRWDEQTERACRSSVDKAQCVVDYTKARVDGEVRSRCASGMDAGERIKAERWTEDQWNACVANMVLRQPGWSIDMTDRQLQLYCNASGIDGAQLTRDNKIRRCASPFFTAHAKMRKADLQSRCGALTGMEAPLPRNEAVPLAVRGVGRSERTRS
jgi:hypothetical protein